MNTVLADILCNTKYFFKRIALSVKKQIPISLLTLALFTAGYAQTLGKAKRDQFFDRLTEEREPWQAVNSNLQGIWRPLSTPAPANHAATAVPMPQEP